MSRSSKALLGLVLAVLALGVAGFVYLARRGARVLTATASGATAGKRRCTAEDIEAGVTGAMAAGQGGAKAYSGTPPSEGEQGATAAGVGSILAGPCLPQIEEKLRDLLKNGDARVRAAAKAALGGIDKARTDALRAPGDAVTNLGKSGKKTAKKAAKRVGIKL